MCIFTSVVVHVECSNILKEEVGEKVNRKSQKMYIIESLLLELIDVGICKSNHCFPHLHRDVCFQLPSFYDGKVEPPITDHDPITNM